MRQADDEDEGTLLLPGELKEPKHKKPARPKARTRRKKTRE